MPLFIFLEKSTSAPPPNPQGITMYDENTGKAYCIKIKSGNSYLNGGNVGIGTTSRKNRGGESSSRTSNTAQGYPSPTQTTRQIEAQTNPQIQDKPDLKTKPPSLPQRKNPKNPQQKNHQSQHPHKNSFLPNPKKQLKPLQVSQKLKKLAKLRQTNPQTPNPHQNLSNPPQIPSQNPNQSRRNTSIS